MEPPYVIEPWDKPEELAISHTAYRTREPGIAHRYSLEAVKDTYLILSYVVWESGNREIRTDSSESWLGARVARMEHGLRLTIDRVEYEGERYDAVPLRSARIQQDGTWSNLFHVSLPALEKAAGIPAVEFLRSVGVRHFLKTHEFRTDGTRKSNLVHALYAPGERLPAIHAYAITRLLPLLNNMRRSNQLGLWE